MNKLDEILIMLNLKKSDPRTREEILEDLEAQAASAEATLEQTKKAFECKERIAKAEGEKAKILLRAKAYQKSSLTGTQITVVAVGIVIFFMLLLTTC